MSKLTSQEIMERGRREYFESQSGLTIGAGQAYRAGFDYAAKHLILKPTIALEDVIIQIRDGSYNDPRESRSVRAQQLAQFEADALNATGLANHPKAESIFRFAYNQDHGSSLEEVLSTLQELAEALL